MAILLHEHPAPGDYGIEPRWTRSDKHGVGPAMRTLSDAIERLVRRGFTANFGVVGDRLRAFDSGRTFGANEVIIREYQRFEGISDPGDMAIVYAIETKDGTRGSLVDAFGTYSNPTVSAFLHNVLFDEPRSPAR